MNERRPRLLEAAALWDYALKVIAGRAHSIGELREKLRRRAARAADIDVVIGRMKEDGYLMTSLRRTLRRVTTIQ